METIEEKIAKKQIKNIKDIKGPEFMRIEEIDPGNKIMRQLQDEGYTYEEAAVILAQWDARERIGRVGEIEKEDKSKTNKKLK